MVVRVHQYPITGSPFEDLFDTFEREIGSLFGDVAVSPRLRQKFPAVDIAEYEGESMIVAELPGVTKENLKISLEGDILTISGERRPTNLPEKSEWVRNEVRTGSFSRTIRLPHDVNRDSVTADLKDGLLRIVLPKTEVARPREIKIH